MPSETPQADWSEVAYWWSLLDLTPGELVEVRRLAGGASGSAVHWVRVDWAGGGRGDFVLKLASDHVNRERACRELSFYQDLASSVPVLVPTLVASVENCEGICLLFESAGTPASPAQWERARWEALAAELGDLHRDQAAASRHSWAKVAQPVGAPEIAAASESWAALGYAGLLAPMWSKFGHFEAALAALPVCLRHGDWHLGNILTGPADRFVWIDWQEVGPGHGPEDLALLWQRAECDGLAPPRAAMLTAYARARGIPDDLILHRATVAAELTLLLLSWPPYLTVASEPARARLFRRLEHLVSAWEQ